MRGIIRRRPQLSAPGIPTHVPPGIRAEAQARRLTPTGEQQPAAVGDAVVPCWEMEEGMLLGWSYSLGRFVAVKKTEESFVF